MFPTQNLGDPFSQHRDSEAIAMIDLSDPDKPVSLTYSHLNGEANRYAQKLVDMRLAAGSRVGIVGMNSSQYFAAYLGVLRAGCVAVPINIHSPVDVIHFIFSDAEVRTAFVGYDLRRLVPERVELADLETPDTPTNESGPDFDNFMPGDSETAEILYTSGSTGRPKGVVLSHRSQLEMLIAMGSTGRQPPFKDRIGIVAAPLFHMNALIFATAILSHGGTVALMRRFETEVFADALVEYQVQLITGVPTMIVMLYQHLKAVGMRQYPFVRTVYIGSSPVTDAVIDQAHELFPKAEVINSYGTTETGGGIFGSHPKGIERAQRSVGYPLPHVSVRLVNRNDANSGELEVRSPTNMSGYLNLPEMTAKKVRKGWINTGDIFSVDGDGFYYYVGRADDMFVCNGENIYPGELELLIESMNGVVQSAVVPMDDERRGEIPVAFVVTSGGTDVLAEDIKRFVLSKCTPNAHPRHVILVDELPLAATNKIDKKKLQEIAARTLG
jgi:long-chain acyl-CoA synthetase